MRSQINLREQRHAIRIALAFTAALLLGIAASTWQTAFAAPACNLIISEFRLRGTNGANDEFVEIYNNSGAAHTVQTSDGSAGYALVASDGVARFVIPNGTVISGRGHYLGVNSVGYSLQAYPAGNSMTAAGDITYTTDIPDNAGLALFRSAKSANWTLINRLDAVGSTSEPKALYREGNGYPALTPFSIDYSFYRDLASGFPKDTDKNAADFLFVDTNGTSAGAGQRLGAPGPENLSSPIRRKGLQAISPITGKACAGCSPNRVRDFTSDPANNSTFGTVDIRRKFVNNTNQPITRLRFRIVNVATFPSPQGTADLRPRNSSPVVVSIPGGGVTTAQGTTLEEPSDQPNGGGFNSSMSAAAVTLGSPLAPGGSINVRFLMGIQQTGKYRLRINVEARPFSSQAIYMVTGDTEGGEQEARTSGDYDGDMITDLAIWKPNSGNWTIVKSSAGSNISQALGENGDKPAPGDYDGDGRVDLAVFRPSASTFYILKSSDGTTQTQSWGESTDIPVPGDYDGDGKTDMALFRPDISTFYIIQSSNNTKKVQKWGTLGDIPAIGDYDGDNRTDFAIYRPSTHLFRIRRSSDNVSVTQSLGLSTDMPLPGGDYDRDGKDDMTVFRPSNAKWIIYQTSNGVMRVQQWGNPGDVPQPGDFDGDGRNDFAVWRPSDSTWYVLKSSEAEPTTKKLGSGGDVPVSSPVANP
jgi:hypothetical protein